LKIGVGIQDDAWNESEIRNKDRPAHSVVERNTAETRIAIHLTIEGSGQYNVTPAFASSITCWSSSRATAPSISNSNAMAISTSISTTRSKMSASRLGEAFDRALGDKRGILRAGYFLMPMDETLAIAAVDLSGRAAFAVDTKVRTRLVGDLQTELVTDFFEGFARGARANVHVKTMYGRSNHHKIEAIFKAFARALRVACSRDKQLGENAAQHKRTVVMRVTVIDYKAGNLTSVLKALRHLGAEAEVTDADLALVENAERIVLPGVGHFQATERLDATGLTT
jgi:imidazoleglycerol-phosphate dehydratase